MEGSGIMGFKNLGTSKHQLFCGDCLEILRDMSNNSIDLVLTDPPYGINRDKLSLGKGYGIAKDIDYGEYEWDKDIPKKEIFEEMFRVSKNQIIFGGNYFVKYLKNSSCWLVWDKCTSDLDFADCELAWTSFNKSVKKYVWKWRGMLQENMNWKDKRVHPAQKPLGLFRKIIDDFTKKDDLICDPFMGSGTTSLACKQLGRRSIGIEINPKYVEIARERLAQCNLKKWFK